jgi:hypothetical protein
MIHEEEVHSEREVETGEASENSYKPRGHVRMQQVSSSVAVSQQADDLVQGNFTNATSIASSLGEYVTKLFSFFKSQSQISLVLVIAFIVIILMQVCKFPEFLLVTCIIQSSYFAQLTPTLA